MNRHYLNLEQDKEQPRCSWDHFASWGIDLWTFGQLNFQSFPTFGFRTPGDPMGPPRGPQGTPREPRGEGYFNQFRGLSCGSH